MKEIFDYIDYVEDINKEINLDWKNYINSKQNDLLILNKLKELLGIVNIREDISYDSKRKENIIETKKIKTIDEVVNFENIKTLSDLKFKYNDENFISEYIIDGKNHIINNCYFENEGQDLYIREFILSKITKDLDTTINLLQIYSIIEGLLYFYSNNEYDMFVVPFETETKEALFNKQKDIFETKLNFAKQICKLIEQ